MTTRRTPGGGWTLSAAGPEDIPFLWEMLTWAASMSPGGPASVPEAQVDPYLRTYVEGWGRPDDLAVVARASDGTRVGAAWLRRRQGGPPEYRLGENDPELAIAVCPQLRGRGLGTLLMERLLAMSVERGEGIVLSVRAGSRAAQLYERLGFRTVREHANRAGGVSRIMRWHPG